MVNAEIMKRKKQTKKLIRREQKVKEEEASDSNSSSSSSGSSGEEEEGECAVCKGENSTKKNMIVFCDGRGCDLPVHEKCYGIEQVPPGDESWFCERCADKVPIHKTKIICCRETSGALKRTNLPKQYIHVLCGIWNPFVNCYHDPWIVDKSQVNAHKCYLCSSSEGLCIQCQYCPDKRTHKNHPKCSRYFHINCALKERLIILNGTSIFRRDIYCLEHKEISTKESKKRLRNRSSAFLDNPLRKKHKRNSRNSSLDSENSMDELSADQSSVQSKDRQSVSRDQSTLPLSSSAPKPSINHSKRRKSDLTQALQALFDNESSDSAPELGTNGVISKSNPSSPRKSSHFADFVRKKANSVSKDSKELNHTIKSDSVNKPSSSQVLLSTSDIDSNQLVQFCVDFVKEQKIKIEHLETLLNSASPKTESSDMMTTFEVLETSSDVGILPSSSMEVDRPSLKSKSKNSPFESLVKKSSSSRSQPATPILNNSTLIDESYPSLKTPSHSSPSVETFAPNTASPIPPSSTFAETSKLNTHLKSSHPDSYLEIKYQKLLREYNSVKKQLESAQTEKNTISSQLSHLRTNLITFFDFLKLNHPLIPTLNAPQTNRPTMSAPSNIPSSLAALTTAAATLVSAPSRSPSSSSTVTPNVTSIPGSKLQNILPAPPSLSLSKTNPQLVPKPPSSAYQSTSQPSPKPMSPHLQLRHHPYLVDQHLEDVLNLILRVKMDYSKRDHLVGKFVKEYFQS